MQVVRIEHPRDEKGLWTSQGNLAMSYERIIHTHSNYEEICERHSNRNEFPNYWLDKTLNQQISECNLPLYRFAFATIEKFKTALTQEELKECIEELGFKVYLITTSEDYFESEFQVVFNPLKVEQKQDISSIFI